MRPCNWGLPLPPYELFLRKCLLGHYRNVKSIVKNVQLIVQHLDYVNSLVLWKCMGFNTRVFLFTFDGTAIGIWYAYFISFSINQLSLHFRFIFLAGVPSDQIFEFPRSFIIECFDYLKRWTWCDILWFYNTMEKYIFDCFFPRQSFITTCLRHVFVIIVKRHIYTSFFFFFFLALFG